MATDPIVVVLTPSLQMILMSLLRQDGWLIAGTEASLGTEQNNRTNNGAENKKPVPLPGDDSSTTNERTETKNAHGISTLLPCTLAPLFFFPLHAVWGMI